MEPPQRAQRSYGDREHLCGRDETNGVCRSLKQVSSRKQQSPPEEQKIVFRPELHRSPCVPASNDMQDVSQPETLLAALHDSARLPAGTHTEAWSWRSAVSSAMMRGQIFLAAKLHDGAANTLGTIVADAVLALYASGKVCAVIQRGRKGKW